MSLETAPSFPSAISNDPSAISNEEKRAIGNVVERLQHDFAHLSTDRVVTTVREVHERYSSARVRDFVPLFVERHATDELNQD